MKEILNYKYKGVEIIIVRYVEFNDKYKERVIDFWIKVCIDEFGFQEWKDNIINMNNHLFKENNGGFWLALDDERVVGTISLENLDNKKCLLKGMYVDKEYRKQGIASRLWNIFLDFAKKIRYKKILLDTYEQFVDAIIFYEKFGFIKKEKIGQRYIYEKEIKEEGWKRIAFWRR